MKNEGMPLELCEHQAGSFSYRLHYLEGIPLVYGEVLEAWSGHQWLPVEYQMAWKENAGTILFRDAAREVQHLSAATLFRWPEEEANRLRRISQREERQRLRKADASCV